MFHVESERKEGFLITYFTYPSWKEQSLITNDKETSPFLLRYLLWIIYPTFHQRSWLSVGPIDSSLPDLNQSINHILPYEKETSNFSGPLPSGFKLG